MRGLSWGNTWQAYNALDATGLFLAPYLHPVVAATITSYLPLSASSSSLVIVSRAYNIGPIMRSTRLGCERGEFV